ncbi:LisH domain-containing protein [Forsythia ovata]|uniref:LisH domain-containing protein n=1 Tax=Forsythia ovata TaxID=205694 RepID=A0ABD1SR42_9LAMI
MSLIVLKPHQVLLAEQQQRNSATAKKQTENSAQLKPENKSLLAYSIALWIENSGFSKALKHLISEAQIQCYALVVLKPECCNQSCPWIRMMIRRLGHLIWRMYSPSIWSSGTLTVGVICLFHIIDCCFLIICVSLSGRQKLFGAYEDLLELGESGDGLKIDPCRNSVASFLLGPPCSSFTSIGLVVGSYDDLLLNARTHGVVLVPGNEVLDKENPILGKSKQKLVETAEDGGAEYKKASKKKKGFAPDENENHPVEEVAVEELKRRKTGGLEEMKVVEQQITLPGANGLAEPQNFSVKKIDESINGNINENKLEKSSQPKSGRRQQNSSAEDSAGNGYGAKAQEIFGQVNGRTLHKDKAPVDTMIDGMVEDSKTKMTKENDKLGAGDKVDTYEKVEYVEKVNVVVRD